MNAADDAIVGEGDFESSGESPKIKSSSHPVKDEIEAFVPQSASESSTERSFSVDQACQTTLDFAHLLEESKRAVNRLKKKVARQGEQLKKLQADRDEIKKRLLTYESNKDVQAFINALQKAQEGDKAAIFISNQVASLGKKKPIYDDVILRECVLWKACSNKGYEHVRSRGLLKLPCRATLQKYVGHSSGEVGVTSLIRERLRVERERLSIE